MFHNKKHKVSDTITSYKKKKRLKKHIIKYDRCSICLEDIVFATFTTDNNKYFLPCCHFFHKDCVDQWLENNTTCPECRIPVFIQDDDQLKSYRKYLEIQKNSSELRRDNMPTNDNAISLMFMRDETYFSLDDVELRDNRKFQAMIDMPEPSLDERYGHLNSDGSGDESDNFNRTNNSEIDQESEIPGSPNISEALIESEPEEAPIIYNRRRQSRIYRILAFRGAQRLILASTFNNDPESIDTINALDAVNVVDNNELD